MYVYVNVRIFCNKWAKDIIADVDTKDFLKENFIERFKDEKNIYLWEKIKKKNLHYNLKVFKQDFVDTTICDRNLNLIFVIHAFSIKYKLHFKIRIEVDFINKSVEKYQTSPLMLCQVSTCKVS